MKKKHENVDVILMQGTVILFLKIVYPSVQLKKSSKTKPELNSLFTCPPSVQT